MESYFDGQRFANLRSDQRDFIAFLRWRLKSRPGDWKRRLPSRQFLPPDRVEGDAVRLTFVNHSTLLIQTGGLNLLTDPHWSERASPVRWVGPRRHQLPGVRFEDLPAIDAVLVSHNHYDHMDLPTLRQLARRHNPRFVVPLGNRVPLQRRRITRVTELDWWQSMTLSQELRIHAVPAQHWSRRGLFDTNRALWAGFYIERARDSIYFAGDTAMEKHFQEIRTRLGPPVIAMLPIGAYKPRAFMAPAHISPDEAIAAFQILGAEYLVPIHFGTFRVGGEGQNEPLEDLQRAVREAGILEEAVWILRNGESRLIKN